jgi:hypothetical protein
MGFLARYQPFKFPLNGAHDSPEVTWTFRVMSKAEKDQFLAGNSVFLPRGATPPEELAEGASEQDRANYGVELHAFERAVRAHTVEQSPQMARFAIEWVARLTHDVEGLREGDVSIRWPGPDKREECEDLAARLTADVLFTMYRHIVAKCAGMTAEQRGN